METALLDGEIAFRQHAGGHTTSPNWPVFLRYASRYVRVRASPSSTRSRVTHTMRSPNPPLYPALAALLAGCAPGAGPSAAPATSPPPSTAQNSEVERAFAAGEFTATNGTRLPYRLVPPPAIAPGRRYPLVLQLHGSGAIGTDNRAQLSGYARRWVAPGTRERFPAYVLVPQFPARTADYSAEAPGGLPSSRALPPLDAALELVDSLRRALPVDTGRVYAVGFSMGGSSVWHALLRRPTVFAAAISIAGVPPDRASLLRVPRVPLLLLHGTADAENPYAGSRAAYEVLREAGRAEVELRPYPGLGHELPPDVMGDDGWIGWLFARRR